MINITEDNIAQWASSQKAAENLLPELIRRIILGTVDFAEISQIEFGAGRAVGFGGFDGTLRTKESTLFSSTKGSVWELSIRQDIGAKADEDYHKRLPKADGAVTYIALTGRLWAGKKDWAEEKNEDGKWAEVRAYDATDIATWLPAAPRAALSPSSTNPLRTRHLGHGL